MGCREAALPQRDSHGFEVVLAYKAVVCQRPLHPGTRVAFFADGISPNLSLERQRTDQPRRPHARYRLEPFERTLMKQRALLAFLITRTRKRQIGSENAIHHITPLYI